MNAKVIIVIKKLENHAQGCEIILKIALIVTSKPQQAIDSASLEY
jgi:hypothetical protein